MAPINFDLIPFMKIRQNSINSTQFGKLLFLICGITCFQLGDCFSMNGVEGEGSLQFTIIQENGLITQSTHSHWQILVQNDKWYVHLRRDGDAKFDYCASYDNTNLYGMGVYISLITESGHNRENPKGDVATATIDASCVPHFIDVDEIPVIWFAYASRNCLEARHDLNTFDPISIPGIQLPAFNLVISGNYQQPFHIIQNKSGFPEYACWLDDGWIRNEYGPTSKRWAPFDTGYTNSIFKTLSFADVGGLKVPSHFIFQTFRPIIHAKTHSDIFASYTYEGWFTNLNGAISSDEGKFVPNLVGLTHVQDRRFARKEIPIEIVDYQVSSNWPTVDQVTEMPAYRKSLRLAVIDKSIPHTSQSEMVNRHRYSLTIILLANSAVLIFLAAKLLRKQKDTKC
jgi:hypothetical protein